MKVYECESTSCTLGTRKTPGKFTGGATKEQITVLTGDPEPEHYGEGVCPSCGELATKSHTEPDPHEGTDPYDELHQEIHARVMDENDPLTKDDAQAALMELVEPVVDEEEDDEGDDS